MRSFLLRIVRALIFWTLELLFISLSVSPLLGQTSDSRDGSAGAGFFAVGTSTVQIGDINSRLKSLGYPTCNRAMLALGGAGYGVVTGRIMLGSEGFGLITGEKVCQGRSIALNGGYGLLHVGYLHRITPSLRIYPMLGIGGGGLVLNIGSEEAGSFDEVLQNPNRQATL